MLVCVLLTCFVWFCFVALTSCIVCVYVFLYDCIMFCLCLLWSGCVWLSCVRVWFCSYVFVCVLCVCSFLVCDLLSGVFACVLLYNVLCMIEYCACFLYESFMFSVFELFCYVCVWCCIFDVVVWLCMRYLNFTVWPYCVCVCC